MRTLRFLLAWIHHFALNLGSALGCVFYAIIPPQWTGHTEKDLSNLRQGSVFSHFWHGLVDQMGFGTLIRNGVALAHTLTSGEDGIQVEVSHLAWIGQDVYGNPEFDDPVTLSALLNKKIRLLEVEGRTFKLRSILTFLQPIPANGEDGRDEPIDPRDRFIEPDGGFGEIVDIGGLVDRASGKGYYHKVWIGSQGPR